MTDEQWAKVEPLARAKILAKQRLDGLGVQGMAFDLRKQMEQHLEYERAEIEFLAATKALVKALA